MRHVYTAAIHDERRAPAACDERTPRMLAQLLYPGFTIMDGLISRDVSSLSVFSLRPAHSAIRPARCPHAGVSVFCIVKRVLLSHAGPEAGREEFVHQALLR
jgi:hypothetical protein